ncbi:Ku protein [Kitasatospora sp. NBC_01287]|uniref:non-homologous end joining protein Ku n=1 Tax=Kitasatospora sp. NBC_01287 TaxID=2903573 RepID=UPI002257B97B|nr:Ku protein [Kitasatospora sp. NBC_01287]MCX4744095.1 Ku protein [Kitasatospora sp. NBC_01287]
MARPVWTGVLSFGLVTVPIALYSATESHSVSFRQIERGTADRVRNKRVNERTGEEVPFADIVKGYEVGEGEYVVIEPGELEQLSPGRSKTIEITGFVDLAQVAPIYFDTTYYIGPKGKEYAKVYALLQRAMERSNRAGLALFSMRGKEYLTAVKAEDGILSAHTMHFADEVRDPHREVDNLPEADLAVSDRELSAAEQLIEMLAVDWVPEDWHDSYGEQVRELVRAKAEGREITVSEGPAQASNVVDLVSILERSLAGGDRASGAEQANAAGGPDTAADTADAADAAGAGGRAPTGRRTPKSAGGTKNTSSRAAAGTPTARKTTSTAKGGQQDLGALTKAELYKRATELDIPHRSTMTRDQLQDALEHTTPPERRHLRSA